MSNNLETIKLFPKSTDPIFIGTGGFRIGRVDNTIVRDPITNIPKIPGSSLAGTWRYYMAMELQSKFKEDYRKNRSKRAREELNDLFVANDTQEWINHYNNNRYAAIKCAGQDDLPEKTAEDMKTQNGGHCGHCIVCKTFGFSKNDKSFQGLAHFSDLNILFFPVATRKGVRWITSKQILEDVARNHDLKEKKEKVLIVNQSEDNKDLEYLNLGWMNLKVEKKEIKISLDENKHPKLDEIVIVPDNLIAQIINSNLEVRTSVSIDPYTGAAKKGALFTSEAIPRSTYFYGAINIFDRPNVKKKDEKKNNVLTTKMIKSALRDSSKYYRSMGIGGMTTRGFGRIDMIFG